MASFVDRATSDMLIGPDWAKNVEICDVINSDPMQAKDVVKAVKKRLGSKNPKVQLLAVTVLETMIKNCGDVVHHQVVERDVLHEMVKIVKKKRDLQVKERILVLLNSWQEAFGGRYPQYVMACDELQRSGFRLPRRAESSAPIVTPPQTQPIGTYPRSPDRSPSYMSSTAETSGASDLPVLSSTEIHTAHSVMEVLMDMLNAIDPRSKQALRDEVIGDLVEQCQVAKRRVMQLVNSTSDEELLRRGLALNDDLQRVLAKHDALASGSALPKGHIPTAPPAQLINVDHDQEETIDDLPQPYYGSVSSRQPQNRSLVNGAQRALLPPPQPAEKRAATAMTHKQTVDLLSGDTYQDKFQNSQNSKSLVPTSMQYDRSLTSLPEQGALIPSVSGSASQAGSSTYLYGLSPQKLEQQNVFESNDTMADSLSQQSNYQQFQPHMQGQGQFSDQLQDANYMVPLAKPTGQSLSSQQHTLLYGSDVGTPKLQSPQNPQQLVPSYNSQPLSSQPVSLQAYATQLQPQQAYGSPLHPQQTLNLPQPQLQQNLSSPPLQSNQAFSTLQQQHQGNLPAPPWSRATAETGALPVQYGYGMAPPVPEHNIQSPQWHQFQQQHMVAGQLSPYLLQPNFADHMQSLSLGSGGYYNPGKSTGQSSQQLEFQTNQRQVHLVKEERPEDKLFKDLVDFAKSKNDGRSNK